MVGSHPSAGRPRPLTNTISRCSKARSSGFSPGRWGGIGGNQVCIIGELGLLEMVSAAGSGY